MATICSCDVDQNGNDRALGWTVATSRRGTFFPRMRLAKANGHGRFGIVHSNLEICLVNTFFRAGFRLATLLGVSLFLAHPASVLAAPKTTTIETLPAVMVGDRVVDIAYNLGVLPECMSVRASLWPMADKFKTVSQPVGCPKCVTTARKNAVPGALKTHGISRVIIEKNDQFCLFTPGLKPENVVPLLKDSGASIEYVDFSQGLDTAIRQTAKLLNREAQGEELIAKHTKELAEVQAGLPQSAKGKTVVIINGTYQPDTGKCLLRVESPRYYADKFLLGPLGCANVGDAFKGTAEASNGHYPVRKIKGEADLSPLLAANPDVIVMTGDATAVQQALARQLQTTPDLAKIKAIRDMAVYALPLYIDSSVIEYPQILRKWALALGR